MPIIETTRLRLRMFRPDDLAALVPIYADPDVMRYMRTGQPAPPERTAYALHYMIDYWNLHGLGLWAVEHQADGALLGQCGLIYLDKTTEIEVAYLLAQRYWGQGYASEAARAALRFGFETLGLDRIVAVVRPENLGSQRVLEKAGLRFERDARYYDMDVKYYVLSRADYQPDAAPYGLRPDDPKE